MPTLPIPANVTVDIYRGFNASNPIPPNNPALSAVPGYLKPTMAHGRFGSAQWLKWTHTLILPWATDIRDAYNTQLDPARNNAIGDTVLITDSNGNKVPYYVVFVEDAYRGTSMAQTRAYLDRCQPASWPSDGV